MPDTTDSFAGWVILELMGHRRLAGWLTEQEIAGEGFLRLRLVSRPEPPGIGVALRGSDRPFLVDAADVPFVTQWLWSINGHGYVVRQQDARCVYLHRLLTEAPPWLEVDHANGDRLDHRRRNLRVCTHAQNLANQRHRIGGASRWRGVARDRRPNRSRPWLARIKVGYRSHHLGTFADEREAALAYDAAAYEHFGAFARLNFPNVRMIRPTAVYSITLTSKERVVA